MSTIPTKLTEEQFEEYVNPYLSKAKRGFVSKIPLYKIFNYILYFLHTGCQWDELAIDKVPTPDDPERREISPGAVAHHFRKWSRDGSLKEVWVHSILAIENDLDLSVLNLDGTHTIAKKGGESVAYQGRKKANTSNILPVTDKNGSIIASSHIIAGNHNDVFELKVNLQGILRDLKALGLTIKGALFNADMAFDTKEARKICFNHGVVPNILENRRNRKGPKKGRPRLFNAEVYTLRFGNERSFAWVDKFKRLLIRFERKDVYFFGLHCIAFAMINLRHLFA